MQKHFLRYTMTVGYKSGMNSKHRSTLYRQLAMELLVQRVERLQVYSAAFVKRQKIVAAIDFGTCNTKIAFAYKPLTSGGDARVVVMDTWENAPAAVMAPTTILIDHTGEVAAYGYEAEEKFRTLPAAQAKISYLFKHFKMALHQKEVRKVLDLHTTEITAISYNYLLPLVKLV